MMRTAKMTFLLVLAVLVSVLNASVTFAADPVTTELYDVQGRVVGSATLTPMDDGDTEVVVKVSGMNPVAGDRALAITERGMCGADGDFSTAGNDAQQLPAVQFYASGAADYKVVVSDISMDALADADGSALVIYADSGEEPGERIICGLLHEDTGEAPAEETPAEEVPAPADDSDPGPVDVPAPADDSDPGPVDVPAEEYDLEVALNEGSGAVLRDVQGRAVGLALLFDLPDDSTGVVFYLEGMEPGSGDHRVALTSAGECEAPDFASAGDEVMALPNVQFYSSGSADYSQDVDDLDLEALRDDDGSSMVIYADAGEDPGDRIICGEVTSAEATLNYFGTSVEEFVTFIVILAG